ncbi:MAG TPA: hypothetical protein VGE65_00215 [Sphingobium sp.]
MSDRFENVNGLADPARMAFAITPHGTNEVDPLPKAIYVGTGGDLVGRAVGSSVDVTFKNLASGQILDVRLQYVRATGTTAANILGLA